MTEIEALRQAKLKMIRDVDPKNDVLRGSIVPLKPSKREGVEQLHPFYWQRSD